MIFYQNFIKNADDILLALKTFLLSPLPLSLYRRYLFLIAVISWAIAFWAFGYGLISDDGWAQYIQANGKDFVSDWHPPLMTRFWQLEIWLFKTSFLLNATWIAIAASGIYLILAIRPCRLGWLLYLLLFYSPFFFGMMGFIYKDIILSDLLFLAAALLIYIKTEKEKASFLEIVGILVLLLLASFLRYNTAFVTAPLIVFLLWKWHNRLFYWIASLAIVIALLGTSPFINHTILKAELDHPETSLEIFDIAGINNQLLGQTASKNAFSYWDTASFEARMSACYTPEMWDSFGSWEPHNLYLSVPMETDQYREKWDLKEGWNPPRYRTLASGWDTWRNSWKSRDILQNSPESELCENFGDDLRLDSNNLSTVWKKSIKQHPLQYLQHRWHFFKDSGMRHFGENALIHSFSYSDPAVISVEHWTTLRSYKTWLGHSYRILQKDYLQNAPWNYGVFWIAIGVFLFLSTIDTKSIASSLQNCFAFGSLMYLFGYFFVGVAGVFRYILPSIVLLLAAYLMNFTKRGSVTANKKTSYFALFISTTLVLTTTTWTGLAALFQVIFTLSVLLLIFLSTKKV